MHFSLLKTLKGGEKQSHTPGLPEGIAFPLLPPCCLVWQLESSRDLELNMQMTLHPLSPFYLMPGKQWKSAICLWDCDELQVS